MCYVLVKEYYSAVKWTEAQTCVTTWVNLEKVMLGKRSQVQKTTYCLIYLYAMSQIDK
jgi:hypothetical protein